MKSMIYLVDIILNYGGCQQNAAASCYLYAEGFLYELGGYPASRRFEILVIRLCDTGCLMEHTESRTGRPLPREIVVTEEEIVEIVETIQPRV